MKEYDKLFYRKLPPSSHLEDSQNSSSSNRIFLKQCLSANELTHFGREATGENQRMTCDEEERVGQETRLDKRWKGKSSASQKNLPRHKLQLFLKETNCRAAANKVKYEYSTSAILEASKRKVQKRSHNATACEANIPEKEPLAKVGRRKDQGFVFYRPEKKKLLIV